MRALLVIFIATVAGLLTGGSALAAIPTTLLTGGPADGSTTSSASPAFTFASPDLTATFECSVDLGTFAACASGDTVPGAPLAEGTHTFTARAVNIDGADPIGAASTFTVDTIAPTVSISDGPTGLTASRSPSFGWTSAGTGTAVVTVECRFDGAAFAACTSPHTPAAPLADGGHQFDVRVTDGAGNLSAVASRPFTVNGNAPVVAVTGGPSGNTGQKTPAFTFTAGPGAGAALNPVECRFDAEAFVPCATATSHARLTAFADGAHTFQVRATNAVALTASATRSFTVHSGAVIAAFTAAPLAPLTNEAVAFTATSTDADGAIVAHAWDLDNDGQFESAGASASRSFRTPGTYTVRLRSTDEYGAVSTTQQAILVGNRRPVASFAVSPASAVAGGPVTFIATSTDADGPTPAAAWDLSGDGTAFKDGAGATATRTFAKAGSYVVRLRATDADGATDVASTTVTVGAAPVTKPAFLSPPPVIRIAGRITTRGVSVTLLSVKAPSGARVRITCTGRTCPLKTYTRSRGASSLYPVFARRLRAGVVLEVRVTKPGLIGRYTRFLVRRNVAPSRTDRCLMPGRTIPVRCPS